MRNSANSLFCSWHKLWLDLTDGEILVFPFLLFYYFKIFIFIYVSDCAGSLLYHAGSLVVVCQLLVVACGIWFPDQGSNPGHPTL